MNRITHKPDFNGIFSDKRLDQRGNRIGSILLSTRGSSIKGATKDEAAQKGFYRFLENPNVEEQQLVKELSQRCSKNAEGRHVIVLSDTSSIGLNDHRNRIKPQSGAGLVGNKTGLGFLAHCNLVVDAHSQNPLGFSDIHLWHREEDKSNNTTRAYKKQAVEEKESYRWIQSGLKSKEVLSAAQSITIVEDREGDIYEQFCMVPDDKTHLLIRSRDNRNLANGEKLYDALAAEPLAGNYSFEIEPDNRKGRKKRTANIAVRFRKVIVQKPSGRISKDLPRELELYGVEAKEVDGPKKDSVKWRILTTHSVNSFEEALTIINMYQMRWHIEQVFRLLKRQGFRIEESELSTGWAIRKLTVLLLNNVLRVIQLLLAYGKEESQPTNEVFSSDEIVCLKMLSQQYEKKNTRVQNIYPGDKLSWASWVIARVGGWKGYVNQRPPGPITMKRGLDQFELIYKGWLLAKQFEKDVSTR
jgi:hypothetical protein